MKVEESTSVVGATTVFSEGVLTLTLVDSERLGRRIVLVGHYGASITLFPKDIPDLIALLRAVQERL